METNNDQDRLRKFAKEFGRLLDPVAFLQKNNKALCDTFLKLHELTVNEGVLSQKIKFLMHGAITAAQHDESATHLHLLGAKQAGATDQELMETAFALIPVAGMPSFGIFLSAWNRFKQSMGKEQPK